MKDTNVLNGKWTMFSPFQMIKKSIEDMKKWTTESHENYSYVQVVIYPEKSPPPPPKKNVFLWNL